MKQVKSCGCIILNDDKILFIRHNNNCWSFPKGHQEPGETDFETALRETREEVGLNTTIMNPEPLITKHFVTDENAEKTIYLFLAKLDKSQPAKITIQPNEVTEAKWIKFTELENLPHYNHYDTIFQQLQQRLTNN